MSNTVSHILARGGRRFALNETAGPTTDIRVVDWVNRIVNNGGAAPSFNTQFVVGTFIQALESSGLLQKMITVNCFVPDNLTASMVPLLRGTGFDVWIPTGFVNSDLSVNGLRGNTSNKSLDTGIQPRSTWGPTTGSVGLTYYIPYRINTVSPTSTTNFELLTSDGVRQIDLISCYQGTTLFDCYGITPTTGRYQANNPHFRGILSANYNGATIDGTNRAAIYRYNSQFSPVSQTLTASATPNNAAIFDTTIPLFAGSVNNVVSNFWTPHPLSFFATHLPLSFADFNTLATLIQTMRVGLGGGYVEPDPINDWVKKVVYYGGAIPSVNTQNTLRTFYNGLSSNNLLNKMKVVNCVVPDNLTASLVPLINTTGSYDPWLNSGFPSASNQGFVGDGSSFMDTGFVPAYSYTSSSNGGLTVYVVTSSINQTDCEFGTWNGGGSTLALYVDYQDVTYFDCYNTSGGRINTNNLGFTGYISANHGIYLTGSTIDAVYTASSVKPHGILMSSTTVGGDVLPVTTVTAMQLNGLGLSSHKVCSFFALHDGLTPTDSNNFYNLIQTMRQSLGGGFV